MGKVFTVIIFIIALILAVYSQKDKFNAARDVYLEVKNIYENAEDYVSPSPIISIFPSPQQSN